jgi:hypothetical protein
MPFVPEISAEFSASPEFHGDVLEKDLSTGWAQTSDLQIANLLLFHCANASLSTSFCGIYYNTFWPFLLLLAAGFFWPYLFLLAGIFRPYLYLMAGIFRPYL